MRSETMKRNKLLLSFLQYDWWKIIGTALISGLVLGYCFSNSDELKENEVLEFFVEGSSNDLSFASSLYKEIEGNEILSVHISAYSPDNSQFALLASSNANGISDIFLLSEATLSSDKEYFAYAQKASSADCASISALSYSFYRESAGVSKGIKVFDKNDESYNKNKKISSWFSFSDTTYLFVSNVSSNAGSKTRSGSSLLWKSALAFLSLALG